jgi:exoribonuclease R
MISYGEKLISVEQLDKLTELQQVCEREYSKRNSPPSLNDVTTGDKEAIDTQTEYLSADQIEKGLRAGQLLRGRLNVTFENAKEAFVTADGVKYFVDENRRHFNRAFHYDVVALQPLPESQWGRPVGKRRLVHHRDDDTDENNLSLDDISIPPVPSARVVGILESSHRVYVATMIDVPSNDESAVLVVPMDIRIPKIRVHTKSWRRFVEQRLLIEIDGWDASSNYPADGMSCSL